MPAEPSRLRTIWRSGESDSVAIIDQTRLPAVLETRYLESLADAAAAIRSMQVRGAPLIGVTAAYGLALGLSGKASDETLRRSIGMLAKTRPTGHDLFAVLGLLRDRLLQKSPAERREAAWQLADGLAQASVRECRAIGRHGAERIAGLPAAREGKRIDVLTHCNAGWLATVEWGTALAPVYVAREQGCDLHVWVGETRPRNQGAALTCWELKRAGVPHTLTVDSAAGHLMSEGRVDLVLTGADRVLRDGTVYNKVGTYMKALAARDNGVPFYVAVPAATVDLASPAGDSPVPIEERDAGEVLTVAGRTPDGRPGSVAVAPPATPAINPAFDVTPPRLVDGLIARNGVQPATAEGVKALAASGFDDLPA